MFGGCRTVGKPQGEAVKVRRENEDGEEVDNDRKWEFHYGKSGVQEPTFCTSFGVDGIDMF